MDYNEINGKLSLAIYFPEKIIIHYFIISFHFKSQ